MDRVAHHNAMQQYALQRRPHRTLMYVQARYRSPKSRPLPPGPRTETMNCETRASPHSMALVNKLALAHPRSQASRSPPSSKGGSGDWRCIRVRACASPRDVGCRANRCQQDANAGAASSLKRSYTSDGRYPGRGIAARATRRRTTSSFQIRGFKCDLD